MLPLSLPGPSRPGLFSLLATWIGPWPLRQLGLLLGVVALFVFLADNTAATMARLGIQPGFAFLHSTANFEIGESLIPYRAGDTYARAILAGLLNTVLVAACGCVLATLLGVSLGLARLSGNLLLSGFVQGYVELVRNTPLLLQLFFWSVTIRALPGPRQAFVPVEGVFLSNRGVYLPGPAGDALSLAPPVLLLVAAAIGGFGALRARDPHRGRRWARAAVAALLVAAALVAFGLASGRIGLNVPTLQGFNIRGGFAVSPEFTALLVGLVVNSAASISEIVRSGIQSVQKGQWEAGYAVGLSRRQIMRLIVLPQAMRVITPMLTSSYLDLTKNSSLAVAIGFPDLVSVVNTTANTTGQETEALAIMVGVYLALNLGVSFAMNRYNRRTAMRGMAYR